MWRLSQKRFTNLTLIYSHLTASKVINLPLDRFRRSNYNIEKQHPQMNNSYDDKMLHQLPCTFMAQLYSALFAVKFGHDKRDECKIKVGFHESEIQHRYGFYFKQSGFTGLLHAAVKQWS